MRQLVLSIGGVLAILAEQRLWAGGEFYSNRTQLRECQCCLGGWPDGRGFTR